MKNNNFKKIRKKLRLKGPSSTLRSRRGMGGLKRRQIQIPNIILADKILKGSINLNSLKNMQNKKYFSILQGKSSSEISLEKYLLRLLRLQKKERQKKSNQNKFSNNTNNKNQLTNQINLNTEILDPKQYFKFKKEPEKNKTHWDCLIEEMKWLSSDFERERKMKKKFAHDMVKAAKKSIETRHLEVEKKIKREEQELKKRVTLMARSVNNYWKKIEKLTKHNYNVLLQENKSIQQHNRLLNFINKLQKISTRVAQSLPGKIQGKINTQQDNNLLGALNLNQNQTAKDENNINNNNNPKDKDKENPNLNENTINPQENSNINDEENNNEIAQAAQCAESFLPTGIDLKECKIDTQVPFLLKNELREYQLIGLHWLRALHDNKINGILADEMGLGKTIQTISLIAHLACNKGIWGPHLIIVPTTIIINWEIEFKKWCPSLKILSYYGNQKERKAKRQGWHKANSFNVCITSYKLVVQDYSIFKRKRWYYIILDEAQNIKNFKSKRWQMLLNFKAQRKLLLTGTPLQNDIMEIWSYMHFLMPNLFYSNEEFRNWFHSQFYEAVHNNASLNKKLINSLHSILRPFLLRRLKKDVEKQLPEKIEHVVYCDLTRRQRYLYDEYINSERTQDTLMKNDYFSIMNVLMQLRKVCNHPDLFDSRDYVTPCIQNFQIFFYIPSLILNILAYNPLKDLNLKGLSLIFEEAEKISKFDHLTMIRYFPVYSFYQIIKDIIEKERKLYTPNYNLEEGDILFKRQYNDSTILYETNSKELNHIFTNQNLNLSNNNQVDPTHQFTNNSNTNFGHNLPYPKYICPTNIPLLKNSSLSSYFDIMYEIYTLNIKNPQDYFNSVFKENISKRKKIFEEKKLKSLHEYDLQSRKNIIYNKPIYGWDLNRLIKLNLLPDILNSKKIFYGKKASRNLDYINTSNKVIFNKFFKGNKNKFDEEDYNINNYKNNKIFEGKYPYRKVQSELERLEKILEEKEREIQEENEKEIKLNMINNHNPYTFRKYQYTSNNSNINQNNQYKKIENNNNNNNQNNLNNNNIINEKINQLNNNQINVNDSKNINKENEKNLKISIVFDQQNIKNEVNINNNINNENVQIQENESDKNEKEENELNINDNYDDIDINKIEDDKESNNSQDELIDINKIEEDNESNNSKDELIDINKIETNSNIIDLCIEENEINNNNSEMRLENDNENKENTELNENQEEQKEKENLDLKENSPKKPQSLSIKSSNSKDNNTNENKMDLEQKIEANFEQINKEKENNKIIINPIKNNIDNNKNYNNQITFNKNSIIETDLKSKKNEEKQKEIKDLKDRINYLKKLLKPKIINKTKEKFEEKFEYTYNDTINHLNTECVNEMIFNPQKMMNICDELLTRYKFFIPKFLSKGPQLIPSKINSENQQMNNRYRMLYNNLNRIPNVQKYLSLYKIISLPDKKLVEYDSGKLMKLANLLKRLKQNKSKALIFTQMTRMLDIMEIFLNLHGYTYVRLDGSTRVEVRQQLVDRFNNDPKIFCFISSTRSGGIGLNLTGADSIVFLDTDWNPAMDKQAQDRCHRIGQTRTVHIYRLITMSTIEENIFKKSIQKRELNYVVMEDGKFDTKNFNKINLKSIVEEEKMMINNQENEGDDKIKKLMEFENLKFETDEDQKNLEKLLIKIEDKEDVQAMKNLSKEMNEEYEEENNEKQFFDQEDVKEQLELEKEQNNDLLNDPKILSSLKGIDTYAMKYFKNNYSYDDFVREKEIKTNTIIFQSEESEGDLDDELDINPKEDENAINKLDLNNAYEMYLNKRKEVMDDLEEKRLAEENEDYEMNISQY